MVSTVQLSGSALEQKTQRCSYEGNINAIEDFGGSADVDAIVQKEVRPFEGIASFENKVWFLLDKEKSCGSGIETLPAKNAFYPMINSKQLWMKSTKVWIKPICYTE